MSKFVVLDEADKTGLVTNHIENSSQRKKDHLELALRSRVSQEQIDQRFYYEPVLRGTSTRIIPGEKIFRQVSPNSYLGVKHDGRYPNGQNNQSQSGAGL